MTTTQQKVANRIQGSAAGRHAVGRGTKVHLAVLAATLTELTQVGYAELSVENVAARAGVHKTTVYRRWKDRESLVADAFTDYVAREVPVPDTGTIEGDLSDLARALVVWLTSRVGGAIVSAMISAGHIQEISEIKRHFFGDRLRRHVVIISRAVARGELPADVDPAEVIKTLVAPIYLRLLITAEAIDESTADRAVTVALAAARAGALSASVPNRRRIPFFRNDESPEPGAHRTGPDSMLRA